jgi:glycosyltransferase involved in cell wall biosynthesis
MKIAFAGRWHPQDKKSWSGTYYYSYRQLSKQHQVTPLVYKWPFYVREWLILKKQYAKLVLKKQVTVEFLTGYAQYFSRQLDKDLARLKPDVVFAPASPQLVAYLRAEIPVVFLTDATFQQIQGYYGAWQNLAGFSLRQGRKVDSRAFLKAAHCLLASDWCRQSAINDYGVAAGHISIAPLGANLDEEPQRHEVILTKKDDTCRLLFLGVEWERKGGQIAYDTYKALQQKGLPCQLTIIGCVPPFQIDERGVTVIPFLDKHDAQQARQLYEHLKNASFLLLPTRAEAAGVVFCEAAAYGVPSIATRTGGVPTYVREGENGFLLDMEQTGAAYASTIHEIFTNNSRYEALRHSSRHRFETTLNWNAWGDSFETVLTKILR